MSDIIKNAIDGQKKAFAYLYSSTKDKLFYIADTLLENKSNINDVIANAYKSAFTSMSDEKVQTEKDFDSLVLRLLGAEIRNVSEKSGGSFKVPTDRNFMNTSKIEVSDDDNETADKVFSELSPLQKFVFIFSSLGSLGKKDMAFATGLDIKTTDVLIDAVKGNIKRISLENFDFDKMSSVFAARKTEAFPEECDKKVLEIIDELSKADEVSRKKRLKIVISIAVAACLLIIGLGIQCAFKYSPEFNPEGVYRARIVVEGYGTITVEMDAANAPITVENFFNLVRSDFYDGLTFHRIQSEYLIHGGSPDGTNWGASANNIYGEFSENGFENGLSHTRGVISMARSDHYDSGSCQFFILKTDITELDGKFAAFGTVVRGMDVVDKMCEEAVPIDSNGVIPQQRQPVIKKITISRVK